MTSNTSPPLVLVCKGQEVFANYRNPQIPDYQGNPLIEALPPILGKREALKHLAYFPTYDEEHRHWDAHLRLHLLPNTLKFFTPLGIHMQLLWQIETLIRLSYVARNPAHIGFWQDINQRVDSIDADGFALRRERSTAKSLTIIGVSGVGKTTAVEEILLLYPQVINHSHYQGQDFTIRQLVWLKLECPYDGSVKGLCLNFFQAVDSLLGTSYYKNLAKGHRTIDELIPDVAQVASNQSLGLLVIDEIQNLSEAKSGGAAKMLKFFVQMINTIGISIVLVGTYKAWSVLSGEFRQIRRGTGLGDLVWEPMKEDETWQTFVKSLWRYQYVRHPCPLTPKLSHTLYYECQGITDFAVKLYLLAQVRAIVTGQEKITESIIKSVAHDCLRTARSVLNALKETNENKRRQLLSQCEDVYPIDIEPFIEQALVNIQTADEISQLKVTQSNDLVEDIDQLRQLETENQLPETENITNLPTQAPQKSTKPRQKLTQQQQTLPEIVTNTSQSVSAYEALKHKSIMRPSCEYIE